MRRFVRKCLITAGILFLIGFFTLLVLLVTNGKQVVSDAIRATKGNKVDLTSVSDVLDRYVPFSLGISINADTDLFQDDEKVPSDGQNLGSGFTKLNLSLGACTVKITPSKDENFYLFADDSDHLEIDNSGKELSLKTENSFFSFGSFSPRNIVLSIPENAAFEKVSMEIGAGEIVVSSLNTKNLDLEVGAGNVSVKAGTVGKLSAEIGAGNVDYQGKILDKAEIECSMGNASFYLDGSKTDYDYDIDCSLGNVSIDKDHYSKDVKIDNDADVKIEIDCSMGNVEIITGQ